MYTAPAYWQSKFNIPARLLSREVSACLKLSAVFYWDQGQLADSLKVKFIEGLLWCIFDLGTPWAQFGHMP